ncbi:hypothetical protein JZ751_011669, partial [Albula glossodonta]
ETAADTPPPSVSPSPPPPSTEGVPAQGGRGTASRGQGILESVLAQKDHLLSQKGPVFPTALPADLLPILGKELGAGVLSPEQEIRRRLRPPHITGSLPTSSPTTPENPPDLQSPPSPTPPKTDPAMIPTESDDGPPLTTALATTAEAGTDPPSSAASRCLVNFSDPEGYIDSSDDPPLPEGAFLQCVYTVKNVNLSEGEQLSIRGVDEGGALLVLANETLLVEGQVIRSPTNTISVFFRSFVEGGMGTFQLHYQIFRLSCALPRRPHFGEVSVLDLHPGGTARFHCHMGYHLQGASELTCLNASLPTWSGKEPSCRAFEKGHCYEPYLQNGNFTTSDTGYGVGTVVQFSCDPGHSLEQALCGGDLSGPSGVILSPNWPEWYGEGEDCSWRIHVGEDKRVLLDVQLLNLSDSDMLTILDGDEVTTRILGQYVGGTSPFKLSSSTPDLTITFHSDPAGLVFGKGEGFIINYMALAREACGGLSHQDRSAAVRDGGTGADSGRCGRETEEVSRNDSCSDLPEIQNGWKTTSHAALVRGARITYQCDPGYDLVGRETLICQLDLSWSTQPPFCEKIMYCSDPGHVEHSTRSLSDPKLLVGTTIQYSCNPGYVLQGSAILTCYGREPGTPVWTSRLPHCVSEDSVSCENPGLPENGYQILYKRLYLPGESLTFMCYQGYELIGEIAIKCILGNPSFWSGPLPLCRANHDCFGNHALEVAEAAADSSLDGGNMALAIFILVLLLSVVLGGAYVYVTRCRYHSNLRLPLMYPHPYSQITVETEFDNPLYETGGVRALSLTSHHNQRSRIMYRKSYSREHGLPVVTVSLSLTALLSLYAAS